MYIEEAWSVFDDISELMEKKEDMEADQELAKPLKTLLEKDHYWFELLADKPLPVMGDRKKLLQLAKKEGGRKRRILAKVISAQSPKKVLECVLMDKGSSTRWWIASVLFDTHILVITAWKNRHGSGSKVVGVKSSFDNGILMYELANEDVHERITAKDSMGYLIAFNFKEIDLNSQFVSKADLIFDDKSLETQDFSKVDGENMNKQEKAVILHQILSHRKSSSEWL